ncbi:MAG: hypothetical protein DBY30_08485 [Verrucomicrobia bacterium]|nr:MAG: hypothetical protein DBY30_08485 [Verrucomicrobiota bacterium]
MRGRGKIFANSRSLASAGSGKTYNLTGRYIALALEEEDPASIIALTFTRKSAGEFLGEILGRTAAAASSDSAARRLSREICGEEAAYSKSDFLALLRRLADNLGRLRLGTIDSFCSSMLGAFAADFGIFSDISVMDPFSERREISAVRERVFRRVSMSRRAFEDFSELVKKATFGQEEKSLSRKFAELAESSRRKLWEHPDLSEWGDERLFSRVKPADWNPAEYAEALSRLRAFEAELGIEKWGLSKFFAESNCFALAPFVPAAAAKLSEIFRRHGKIPACCKVGVSRRETEVPPGLAGALTELFRALLSSHLRRLCSASRSLGEICAAFEREYSESVRGRGKLTFDDIPKILADPERRIGALLMEERMDSKFRHWMFDEFQDTSRMQWEVFKNLVDEAVCDESRARSFFYVGDVKQSIYSWRGGDFRLFGEIFSEYSRLGLMDEGEKLVKSWRSGPNVISLVNAFFSDADALAGAFTRRAADAFCGMFDLHESALPDRPSYVSLSLIGRADGQGRGNSPAEKAAVWEEVYRILRRTDPPGRGKSCAVLLRKNDDVSELVDYVRRRASEDSVQMPIAGELDMRICEGNMVVPPFAQIVKRLAHPSDTASSAMLDMTPVRAFCRGFDADFCARAREAIECGGYSALFKEYEDFILSPEKSGVEKLDGFSLEMLSRLGEACEEFDATLSGGDDAFIAFLRSKTFRSGTAENTVQAMTVHKSKGLGFDMVILPDIHKISNTVRPGLSELREGCFGGGGRYLGMMIMPPKDVCALDPLLFSNLERLRDAQAFEGICALYVALTRAKNAVYVVMPEPSPKSAPAAKNLALSAFGSLGCDSSGNSASLGDPRWYEAEGKRKASLRPAIEPLENPDIPPPLPERERPSERAGSGADSGALKFGELVHEILRACSEGGIAAAEKAAPILGARFGEAETAEAFEATRRLVESESGKKVFGGGAAEVYAELPFCCPSGGRAIAGVIDRLEIFRDSGGGIAEARIVDFKPSAAGAAEKYGRQLSLYAEGVRALFKPRRVRAFVLGYADCGLEEVGVG